MQKANPLSGNQWRQNGLFSLAALLIIAADQVSKTWIRANLAIGESLFEIGLFRLTRVHNTGAAFGLFRDYSSVLTVVAMVGVAALLLYTFFIHHRFSVLDNTPGKFTLGLVLGGTVGNLIDRLLQGSVTDFIDIGIWPTFNIADSAIVVGITIFVYYLLRLNQAEKH